MLRSLPATKVVPALFTLSPAVMETLPFMEPTVLPISASIYSLAVLAFTANGETQPAAEYTGCLI
ncbi:hypothetical protein Ga0466249_004946 [Sporomusaceae bacterium BoRhaA]|nr:hypothetical protein [Pelorhabdus rhamnosifermentans]